ncbi:MAG: small multi-drug export protein [Candidatus Aenigmarchaeota archaeon]|nr:small multi-drug export protein [Candidatus Aenigmarchaeota archaeon]
MVYKILSVIIMSILPIAELRGAIPLGLGLGLDPMVVIPLAIFFNALVFFPVFFGLSAIKDTILYRSKLVQRQLDRIHLKRGTVDKYGYLGLLLLVAIPLPFTGAYTGAMLAWLLGLDWKKSFLSITGGVVVAGLIVSSISLGVINFF